MTENDVIPTINNDPMEKRNEFIDQPSYIIFWLRCILSRRKSSYLSIPEKKMGLQYFSGMDRCSDFLLYIILLVTGTNTANRNANYNTNKPFVFFYLSIVILSIVIVTFRFSTLVKGSCWNIS